MNEKHVLVADLCYDVVSVKANINYRLVPALMGGLFSEADVWNPAVVFPVLISASMKKPAA